MPATFFAVLRKDVKKIETIGGKKFITLERLGIGGEQVGELVGLEFPDGSKATGKIKSSRNVKKTINPYVSNPQVRMLIEILPQQSRRSR